MQTARRNRSVIGLCSVLLIALQGCATSGSDSPVALDSQPHLVSGSALAFDGVDDYVVVPDNSSLDMTNGFTVAAWVNLTTYVEWASIVTKGAAEPENPFINNFTIHQSGPQGGTELGHLRFTGCAALPTPLPESNTVIPTHQWHFVAVTFNGSAVRFYLDGRLDGQTPLAGPLCTNDEGLYIGVDFPGAPEYWHGLMDDLKLWNQALTTTQVASLFHGGPVPLRSALVGDWRFNEGAGNVAHDQSGLRNDGTLVGNPTWLTRNDSL